MVTIKDFASNSVMGVVRKVVNYLTDTLTPKVDGAIDHLPARFNGSFNDNSRVLTMTIESQGASTENLTAEVTIPGGGGGGPTYSAGNGINITSANAIEIDTAVTATKQSVDTLQAQVGDAFTEVAIGADGKSLDFTALDGQVNNIAIPSSSEIYQNISKLSDIDTSKIKTGSMLIITAGTTSDNKQFKGLNILFTSPVEGVGYRHICSGLLIMDSSPYQVFTGYIQDSSKNLALQYFKNNLIDTVHLQSTIALGDSYIKY